MKKQPSPIGTGERFQRLVGQLSNRKGVAPNPMTEAAGKRKIGASKVSRPMIPRG